MNAIEIEEAVSDLAAAPFDRAEFPFAFLAAFGNKETTVKRLRSGSGNASDIPGGVLQRNNIHLAVCDKGNVGATLKALRNSPKTAANRVKFVFATDGVQLEAFDVVADELLACPFVELAQHFGFFLPLAGISTVRQIKDNPIDVKATGRLNKLYVELLKENPDWATEARRPELNRFMARLIFCFFAEDTGIFSDALFSKTIERMSNGQSGNTHEIIAELFRAMSTRPDDRAAANFRSWADVFPFVNGGLFSDAGGCPRFSRMARTYLLRAGELHWQEINPDIFGSMIQAVADDDERGSLGMHYTSVPNILKALNPLFLDDLREKLQAAGESVRKLRTLRRQIGSIRVFDPACGSGNFLVIAYIQMREIEHEIVVRTGDKPESTIPLTNFYGIEIKGFAAEVARLALLIAEFQCDARLIDQKAACSMMLPLRPTGQVHVGNALRTDWLKICPPVTKGIVEEQDLAGPTGRYMLDDNGLTEAEPRTFICGNPPYRGSKWQDKDQKADLKLAWTQYPELAKTTDYVTGWLAQALNYLKQVTPCSAAFVMTNSVVQGQQAGDLWTPLFECGFAINFAHRSFKWQNLAANNAGVTVVVVGVSSAPVGNCRLFEGEKVRMVDSIGCFLIANQTAIVRPRADPVSDLPAMVFGNMPRDGGHLILDGPEANALRRTSPEFVYRYVGSQELIDGVARYCIWINDEHAELAAKNQTIAERLERVRADRLASAAESTQKFAVQPHRFVQRAGIAKQYTIAIPGVSSENRDYLPCDLLGPDTVISNKNFGIFDGPMWSLALIASRLHWVWVATVCVRLEMRFSYSNTLGWNTFPLPPLTEQNKADLSRCAQEILLAREAHFPATIADLYELDAMPEDLRRAHEANDDMLERIYIGRRFRNDTERLEKLFDLYTRLTMSGAPAGSKAKAKMSKVAS